MNPLSTGRAAATIVRQRARAVSGASLVFVLLLGVTVALAVGLPRHYQDALDEALRRTIAEVPSVIRDFQLTQTASLPPGTPEDPLREVRAAGAALDTEMPDSVRALIADGHVVVDSVEFVADSLGFAEDVPVGITQVKLRIQDGVDAHIAWAEGRPPAAIQERVEPPGEPGAGPFDAYEVAFSTETMDTLRLEVGDELVMTPDPNDLVVDRYGGPMAENPVMARIVGRFDIVDPADPYWFEDPGLREVSRVPISIELAIHHATALVHPGAYPRMLGVDAIPTSVALPLRYAWRRSIDPARFDAARLPTLTSDITRLLARYPFSATNTLDAPPSMRWGMLALLERHDLQQRTASVTLALVALGPLATAGGALALVALLVARRRAASDAMLRARGGTGAVVLLAALLEALVLVVPTVVLGAVTGWLLTAGRPPDGIVATGAVMAGVAVALLVAVAMPGARGAVRGSLSASGRVVEPRGTRHRRLVIEGTIVVVAVMAAVALRSRGAGDGRGPAGLDPLLAAVPVLVALAAALVLLRLYPFPLHALAALAARGRGLIPTFPLWGAARHSRLVTIPLLVILVATAMGAFSAAILQTVREGQLAAAWRAVGADWRIDGDRRVGVPGAIDPSAIPGIEGATAIVEIDGRVRTETARRNPVRVDGIDPAWLQYLSRDAPVPLDLPMALERTDWAPTTGTDADPIPVLVTADAAARAGMGAGATFHLSVSGIEAAATIVDITETLPGGDAEEPSVIAPLDALRIAYPGVRWLPTSWLLRGPASAGPAVQEAVAPYGDILAVRSRDAVDRGLRDAPVVSIVRDGINVAIGIAVAYAGLSLLAGLTLAIATRRRDLHILRTLGLSTRGLSSSIVIEQIPLVLVAVVGGAAVGIVTAWLLGPSVGLEAYADGRSALPVAIDPLSTVLVGVVPTAVGVVAVVLATLLSRRADLAGAVRFHDAA